MGEYVGYIAMAILFVGLPFVYFLRKSRERAMKAFYKEHSIFLTKNTSPKFRERLGISEDPYCCQVNLKLTIGGQIPIYWCEWVVRTENPGRTTARFRYDHYLAIFFAPQTVTEDFMRKAIRSADKVEAGVWQKIKDQFAADTDNPFRAEMLTDGTFLIGWQMLKRRNIYESRIEWLKNNVSIR